MMMAVPRSGWSRTSTMGIPAMINRRKTSRQANPSASRRAQYAATAKISARTANSEGCRCKGPMLNQRAAPWALLPTTKTPMRPSTINQ